MQSLLSQLAGFALAPPQDGFTLLSRMGSRVAQSQSHDQYVSGEKARTLILALDRRGFTLGPAELIVSRMWVGGRCAARALRRQAFS